ncbi:site-specific integrase [Subtercola lobariae]|uniref:Site-specific integrase n=1 Tax=Subtercola lobariae TaxID=1588641 RepID=A0A917B0H6_9MICO|nr:tyrosine-type recombinase/integrase [Subtercola lobariae]GGF11310.1 site-specific integrase [Subtercola lobariae]
MSDIYRRCGCRTADGKAFGPLPDRATDKQKAAACPTLVRDSKHGSWGFAVSAGTSAGSGKRVQVRKMGFATKREAQQERAKVIDQIATGRYKGDQKITMAAYLPDWLDRRVRDGMRPSTELMYRRYVLQDILPALGAVKLAELRKFHVDKFVQQLRADGRGATTMRRIHAVLSSALSSAERLDLVDFNAASKIELPSTSKSKTRIWEPDQVRAFLDAIADSRLAPVFELAIFTGLRRGELAGLRWADVDFTKRELVVRQQRVQVGHTVLDGAIKTDSGQDRKVSLGSEAIGALVAWQIRQEGERAEWAAAYQGAGHVFSYEDGRPLRPAHISRTFDTLVERSGLPHMRLHDLRHEHASLLLSGGVDIAVVSKRLGHSTIAVTSDLYSHLLADANRAAADAMESVLPPKTSVAHKLHTFAE